VADVHEANRRSRGMSAIVSPLISKKGNAMSKCSMQIKQVPKQDALYIVSLCVCLEYADRHRHIYLSIITTSVPRVLSKFLASDQ
jgi:hypothetical protein